MAEPRYESLARALRAFGRFRKRWSVLEGLARFLLAGPGTLLAWFLVDWLIGLPAWPLLISFGLVVGVGLWAAAWRLLRPMLRRVQIEREALVAESLHGGLDNQLIGALQLGREVAEARGPLGYSGGLVEALVARTAALLAQMDACALVDRSRARRALAGAGALAVAIACCALFARAAIAARAERLQDAYAAVLDSLFPVEMRVSPGDIAVVRGRPVTLGVEVIGARRRQVRLVRTGLPPAGLSAAGRRTVDALPLDRQKASLVVPESKESFAYAFEYGRRRTPEHRVLVGDRPSVDAINYELAYPAYTGQPARTLVGRVPRLQGLIGTSVLVSFAATTDLHPDLCAVEWQDGSKQALAVNGRFGHFSFTIDRPDRAAIHLTGAYGPGFEMESPISFEVAVQRDEPPTVQILLRQKKLTMMAEEAAAFGLRWLAEDDFGVAEVSLDYRIDTIDKLLGRAPREGTLPRRIDPPLERARGEFLDLFKTLSPPLQPGDRITLTVCAKDNNTETGPSLGRSQPVEIVVVRQDLSAFTEKQFGFGSQGLLGGLTRVKRATDLLVDPTRTVRTETKQELERQSLKSRVGQEAWPSGAEDAVGDYFRLLAGGD